MKYLCIKNYQHFQHYKKRRPVWIKLYTALLDDYEFERLQDASKAHLMMMWILASKTDNKIPWDEKWLSKKMGATTKVDVQTLIDHGFVEVCYQDASKTLAQLSDSASPEKRREEKRREDSDASASGDVVPIRPETPLGIIGKAWEAKCGAKSFPYPKAGKLLKPLLDVDPHRVAKHLTAYLERTEPRFRSLAKFAETWASWEPLYDEAIHGPPVDADGVESERMNLLTSPNRRAERIRMGLPA